MTPDPGGPAAEPEPTELRRCYDAGENLTQLARATARSYGYIRRRSSDTKT